MITIEALTKGASSRVTLTGVGSTSEWSHHKLTVVVRMDVVQGLFIVTAVRCWSWLSKGWRRSVSKDDATSVTFAPRNFKKASQARIVMITVNLTALGCSEGCCHVFSCISSVSASWLSSTQACSRGSLEGRKKEKENFHLYGKAIIAFPAYNNNYYFDVTSLTWPQIVTSEPIGSEIMLKPTNWLKKSAVPHLHGPI